MQQSHPSFGFRRVGIELQDVEISVPVCHVNIEILAVGEKFCRNNVKADLIAAEQLQLVWLFLYKN